MEIERKYLVTKIPFDLSSYEKFEIRQGYLSTDPVIRIRQSNTDFILTVKGKGNYAREEYEMPLEEYQFQNLLKKVETNIVSKTRYHIPLEFRLIAELDVYKDALDGLLTVEVEFDSEEAGNQFIPPNWFGDDVTNDRAYKNSSLSVSGLPGKV